MTLVQTQLLQLTIVIAAVAVTTALFCRRRPHAAYALWLIALAKCGTPPVWSSPTGGFSWAWAEASQPAPPPAAVIAPSGSVGVERRPVMSDVPPLMAPPPPAPAVALTTAAAAVG